MKFRLIWLIFGSVVFLVIIFWDRLSGFFGFNAGYDVSGGTSAGGYSYEWTLDYDEATWTDPYGTVWNL